MQYGSALGHCQRSALWDRTERLQGRALTSGDLTGESACACVRYMDILTHMLKQTHAHICLNNRQQKYLQRSRSTLTVLQCRLYF